MIDILLNLGIFVYCNLVNLVCIDFLIFFYCDSWFFFIKEEVDDIVCVLYVMISVFFVGLGIICG